MDIKIEKLSEKKIEDMNIRSWPIWESDVSRFDWYYDSAETCLLLDGRVVVETDDGSVEIKKGDYVTFPKGLSCVWDVKEPVKKHYNFE
jgi:hypothetical protein